MAVLRRARVRDEHLELVSKDDLQMPPASHPQVTNDWESGKMPRDQRYHDTVT